MPEVKPIKGFTVVRLELTADAAKDDAWIERERKNYSKEDFDREFLLKPVGEQDSYPVFADYIRDRHETADLVYQRHLQFVYRGWDFGKIHPCVEFLQPEHERINVIYEIYGNNILLQPFAEKVLADSALFFPNAKFVDWCDASGENTKDDGRPSMKVLRDLGLRPKSIRREVEDGIADITKYLINWSEGRPKLQINPMKAPQLAAAMRGGYRRKPSGVIMKDGDNDHPVDAFRYAFQGVTHNINASIKRSTPPKKQHIDRPLGDCETYTRNRRI